MYHIDNLKNKDFAFERRSAENYINSFVKKILFPVVFFLQSILYFLKPDDTSTLIVLIFYSAVLMIYLFLKTLDVKVINLFILFALSYLTPLFYYAFGNKIITSYSHSNQLIFLVKYAYIYALFFTTILLFLPSKRSFVLNSKKEIQRKDNFIVFYINIIICVLIAFFSKSGDNLLVSEGYGQSDISNLGGFAIGEYFLIFFFIAYKFSGKKRINKIILITVAGIYILESLAFGLRNEFIQLSILLFILYYKETGKHLFYFIFILCGFYFSSIFANFRSDPARFLRNSVIENLSLSNIVDNESDYYISAQGDVVHSSGRLINFRDNNITDNATINSSAFWFFLSSIIPQKYLPPEANMAAYKQDEYPIGGGGNLFGYFYFWFWYPGVILIGIYIGLIIRYYQKRIHTTYAAYFVLVFATFPRWFSYTPINLFKLCAYGLIVYCCFMILDIQMKKNTSIA